MSRNGRPQKSGLEDVLSSEATTPIMRAIATLAMERRESFGSLCKKLNAQGNIRLQHSNIRKHFEAQRPQDATIEAYGRALGVNAEELRFLAGVSALPAAQVDRELTTLRRTLSFSASEFEGDALANALRFLEMADEAKRSDIASQHRRAALAKPREEGAPRIIAAFKGFLDLAEARRKAPANEAALLDFWLTAHAYFTATECEAVVALAIGLFRRRGIDTAAMEARLILERAAVASVLYDGVI